MPPHAYECLSPLSLVAIYSGESRWLMSTRSMFSLMAAY